MNQSEGGERLLLTVNTTVVSDLTNLANVVAEAAERIRKGETEGEIRIGHAGEVIAAWAVT